MTLFSDFLAHNHRRSHKWYHYFPIYERHFERFRNQHITLFEIGIGEGGSLQQWKRYLGPFARIVGIDVEPMCKQIEEEQIHVRVGSQDDVEFLARVVAEFGNPDIVIDDGGHVQQHVNATFGFLYPLVAKNGVYLVEDLHAAYWDDHGGGLRHEGSFIERAKGYVDEMHAEYTMGALSRTTLGDRTTSIHFYDSVIVMEVGEYRVKGHQITGNAELFRMDYNPDKPLQPARPSPESAAQTNAKAASVQITSHTVEQLDARVRSLEAEIAVIRASTSWRITEPLRSMGRLVRR
jgi:hypothetical protein